MSNVPGEIGTSTIPARLAAQKTTPMPELKRLWRELFDAEPPGFNGRYLESRLAYRLQELAYGGLKPETVRRLEHSARSSTAAMSRSGESGTTGSPSPARGSSASGRGSSML